MLPLLVLASQARSVSAFHAIAIETTADVDVTIGATTKVEVSGPSDELGKLETTVDKHGSLHIKGPKGSKGTTPTYKVTITMPVLDAVAVEGISNVHVAKLTANRIAVAVDGAATLDITGSVESLALAVSGAAQLKLANLKTHETALQVSGLASGSLYVDHSLAVSLSGTATIDLYGKPQVSKSVSGTLELRER
jgi:Putative auto-transporter adhesin, head GIN domain